MRIQLKKGRDGRDTLACHREDGTTTWGPLHPSQPVHDLTHYVVEIELGTLDAFFGLVRAGWDLADFEDRAKRDTMPAVAMAVEAIVGQLDLERLPANQRSWAEFDEAVQMALDGLGLARPDGITADWLERVRAWRAELAAAWAQVAPGGSLDLTFP